MNNIVKALMIIIIVIYYFNIMPNIYKNNIEIKNVNFKELYRIKQYNKKINLYYNRVKYYNNQTYNPLYVFRVNNIYTVSDIESLRDLGLTQ